MCALGLSQECGESVLLMRYLIFMDVVSQNWREVGFWLGLAVLASIAIYLVRSPHMANSFKKTTARTLGALLVVGVGLSSCALMLGTMLGHAPRERTAFASGSGEQVALVSHSSYRDFTTTQVAIKPSGCCTRYIAYDYAGDGDDYMQANAVTWIDEHKIVIRFSTDTSGTQLCRPQVGDIQVICEARPAPVFNNGQCTSNCVH
jgi:hypothetical protein